MWTPAAATPAGAQDSAPARVTLSAAELFGFADAALDFGMSDDAQFADGTFRGSGQCMAASGGDARF